MRATTTRTSSRGQFQAVKNDDRGLSREKNNTGSIEWLREMLYFPFFFCKGKQMRLEDYLSVIKRQRGVTNRRPTNDNSIRNLPNPKSENRVRVYANPPPKQLESVTSQTP